MLQYKNHRLYYEKFSFSLPNGFYLDDELEDHAPDAVHLFSEDMRYAVKMGIQCGTYGAADELARVLNEMDSRVLEPISQVEVNGLCGYHAAYTAGGEYYYELRLNLEESDEGMTEFVVIVRTEKAIRTHKDIPNIIEMIAPACGA